MRANNVFEITAAGPPPPSFTNLGCYKDMPAVARALPNLLSNTAGGQAKGGDPQVS